MATWVKEHLQEDVQDRLPMGVKVIFVGGGVRSVRRGDTAESVTTAVTGVLEDLVRWCRSGGVDIVFASLIPCPADQDICMCRDKHSRIMLSNIFNAINLWIRERNSELEAGQLPLHRFVSHNKRATGRRSLRHQNTEEKLRCYPGTSQDRIILRCFSRVDWCTLSNSGLRAVEKAIHRFCDSC